jgi:hypothetical protein
MPLDLTLKANRRPRRKILLLSLDRGILGRIGVVVFRMRIDFWRGVGSRVYKRHIEALRHLESSLFLIR